ncbi:MAG: phosphatidylserine/phosphatidylglycerophosphate/cardiolipin synthase family protein [bacterium]|nr:phosphatidylserine/phosphatidylglycerophosphate/cardiolipin synthase family protein [bacterium]
MTDHEVLSEILFDDDVFYRIKSILKEATQAQDVYIVTPYVKLDTRTKDAFEEASEKNVRVTMLIRADADHPIDDINWLLRKRVILRKVDKLHAKIYLGTTGGLVASMNLHSFSGQESKEAGVYFRDEASLKKLQDRVNKWVSNSQEVDPVGATVKQQLQEKPKPQQGVATTKATMALTKGHCIRCGVAKTFNPAYPLCDECYREWAIYKNDAYKENFCHKCGKSHDTTVKYPLCKPCWSLAHK